MPNWKRECILRLSSLSGRIYAYDQKQVLYFDQRQNNNKKMHLTFWLTDIESTNKYIPNKFIHLPFYFGFSP